MTALVLQPAEQDLRQHVAAINQYAQGRSNAGSTFTCSLNSTTTTVTDANVASGSKIVPFPTTAQGAGEAASGNLYIATATIRNGSFVVTHTNSATASRTFMYVIQG